MEKKISPDENILEQLIRNPKEYLERKKGTKAQDQEIENTLNNVMLIQSTLDQARSAKTDTTWTC